MAYHRSVKSWRSLLGASSGFGPGGGALLEAGLGRWSGQTSWGPRGLGEQQDFWAKVLYRRRRRRGGRGRRRRRAGRRLDCESGQTRWGMATQRGSSVNSTLRGGAGWGMQMTGSCLVKGPECHPLRFFSSVFPTRGPLFPRQHSSRNLRCRKVSRGPVVEGNGFQCRDVRQRRRKRHR